MFIQNIPDIGWKYIHKWYDLAMSKRRPDSSLNYDSFVSHFNWGLYQNTCFIFGNYKLGFILGNIRDGFYIPSHFAPRTMKSGVKLLKKFSEENVVMFITDDLSKTISKMKEYHNTGVTINCFFRNELVTKYIWSSCPLASFGIKKIYDELDDLNSIENISWDNIIENTDNIDNCDFSYPFMEYEFISSKIHNIYLTSNIDSDIIAA